MKRRRSWLALGPLLLAAGFTSLQERTPPAGDDARRVHELVGKLRSLRAARVARAEDHEAALGAVDEQITALRSDLDATEGELRGVEAAIAAIGSDLDAARADADRARDWIESVRPALDALAASTGASPPIADDIEALANDVQVLFTRSVDAVAAARAIELTNEPVLLEDGRVRVHAWQLRIGGVGAVFASEDGARFGLRGPNPDEPWRLDATDAQRSAIRRAIAVARGRERPALVLVPVPLEAE
ncbi:MAG: DUF3450 family protein [Planctomycetota bacterium]